MKKALILTRDLFFLGKLKAALQSLPPDEEWQGVFVRSEGDFRAALTDSDKLEVVLLDLQATQVDWEQLLQEAHQAKLPVLAFGRHTEPLILRKARQAGAYRAVPNSTLVEKFPQLLALRYADVSLKGELEE